MQALRILWARGVAWLYVGASLVLGWAIPRVHTGPFAHVNPNLGRENVIAFLSSVSSGMMAFTGIVFSLLFILLQFGSSAYSPHLVTMLANNRPLRHAGGVFTGTFLYSLMALRYVGAVDGATTSLTIWTAFAWLVASVYFLLRLIGVFASLNITNVLEMLGDSGDREIDRVYVPYSAFASAQAREDESIASNRTASQTVFHHGRPEYLLGLDVPRLVELAREADGVIRIPVGVGDSITSGVRLAFVDAPRPISEERLRSALRLGRDRTWEQGPKNAMRLLVDIALRALSPAVNDPTTAVHALDQLEALLARLGRSHLDIGVVRDGDGVVRVVHEACPTWEEYLALGVTEIQQYGASAVQVERRLAALLDLLAATVPESRKHAVERLAAERTVVVRANFEEGPSRAQADRVDRQGIGHSMS